MAMSISSFNSVYSCLVHFEVYQLQKHLRFLCLIILSGVISLLFSSSMLGTYQPGEFLFQFPIFLPFHTVHGVLKARILKWFTVSFSSEPRSWISLVAQMAKHLPTMRETWVRSLGQEDPLEKEMATHTSILAWRIPWMEESGGLHSVGSQRVRHDWVTSLHFTYMEVIVCLNTLYKNKGVEKYPC